ncbi:MAG: DUF2490 domain-containing protein [Chitinophagales bacterium]|nr:DUF2490 domain-containing protein [Chitinophagales bacterium]
MTKNWGLDISYKYWVFLCALILNGALISAQENDIRLRSNIGVSYAPIKPLSISASYRLDIDHNMSMFDRSNFTLEMDYSALKWLKLNLEYRFMTSYDKDAHRWAWGWTAKKSTLNKKHQYQWKSAFNVTSNYLNIDYWRVNEPSWVWRNKLKYEYRISKKMDFSVFTENFLRMGKGNTYFYRMRYGTNLDYELKKRHTFAIGYYYQHEWNRKKPENGHTFEIEYHYEIKKKKKPTAS